VNLSEFPETVYLITKKDVLEAGVDVNGLLSALQMFQPKMSVKIQGTQFALGDFVVKIGSIAMANKIHVRIIHTDTILTP
jgi:hypothetical protein